jgi:S-adenosylmethionine:tRNA ribosyltransferase-isomerase
MNTPPYTYDLPKERIAQRPVVPYDAARLMVLSDGQALASATFTELPNYLTSRDLLVFNNTKVIPARLIGAVLGNDGQLGGRVELLLVDQVSDSDWRCLARPMKRLPEGAKIGFAEGLTGVSLGRVRDAGVNTAGDSSGTDDRLLVRFESSNEESLAVLLMRVGMMPIPPYIRGGESDESDSEDYQTRFAKVEGSIAAPTASLHFTESLMAELSNKGVKTEEATLHVGVASFLPMFKSTAPEHGQEGETQMTQIRSAPAAERMNYSPELYERLLKHKQDGGRVIAVGTTIARALESMARHFSNNSDVEGQPEATDLFIQPGFEFQILDGLITNFHQPGTTHLLLVEALTGRARLQEAYEFALNNDYRFLSYGDGMIIFRDGSN